jgi:hypothetical protein
MDISNPKKHAILMEKIPMLLGQKEPLFNSTRNNMPAATWHSLMVKTRDTTPTHQQVLDQAVWGSQPQQKEMPLPEE